MINIYIYVKRRSNLEPLEEHKYILLYEKIKTITIKSYIEKNIYRLLGQLF